MHWDKFCLRLGTGCLVGALLLRIFSGSALVGAVNWPSPEDLISAVVFLETGRMVKMPQPSQPEETVPPTEAKDAWVITDPQLPLSFSRNDLPLLEINNTAGVSIDPEQLLRQPTSWELTQEGPAVLILHTHGTESFQELKDSKYRSVNQEENIISIGAEVTKVLEEGGVQVIHDTTAHDDPSYTYAYGNSREAIQSYLQQYPSIRLILDLHRDAAEDAQGNQVAYTSSLGGETAAQLMLVMGSSAGNLNYPHWQENLTLAVQLQTALQRQNPGICRPLNLRAQRYNQDLHPGTLLIEVGAAGNTHQQAILAARALGEGILSIAHGTTWSGE